MPRKAKKMNMLVIDNIYLFGSGGDYHIARVSKEWSKSQEIMFLFPKTNKLVAKIATLGNVSIIIGIAICYIVRILKTCMVCSGKQFDIVIASSHFPPDILPVLFHWIKNSKSKIVVYLHGILIPPEHGTLLRTLSIMYNYLGMLLAARFADLIFVINKRTRDHLLRLGVEGRKLIVTSNGVDLHNLGMMNEEKSFDACFLGRLNKSKGVYDLVEVWNTVCEGKKNVKLAIIGVGPERGRISELAIKMGLESNIALLGFVSRDKKYEILQNSKIFVFPSYLESWGIAIAEAMACSLPVVAYDLPVYKEVFDDKLITVFVGDIDAMAKQVISLIRKTKVARKIGEEGREFIKRYDWGVVAERELSEIIALKGRSTRAQAPNYSNILKNP